MSALSNLPALSRAYFTRANQPFGANNTTQLIQESFWNWSLATNLANTNTGGTISPSHTRQAASVWIVRGSSNGTTGGAVSAVGVGGTDRWSNGGVFLNTNFVRAANGVNHSWILLENVNISTEMLINMSGTAANNCIQIGHSGLFTGGSVSQTPAPSDLTKSVGIGQTAYEASQGGQVAFFQDTTLFGNTHYFHFTCADSGEFWVGSTRAGRGFFNQFYALWKCTGGEATDTVYNRFVLSNASEGASTPGSMNVARLNSAVACASVTPAGTQKASGGLVIPYAGGTTAIGIAVEAQSAKFLSSGLPVIELTPNVNYRGVLPDLHATGDSPPGASIPLVSQVRTQTGHLIVPFMDTAPNM